MPESDPVLSSPLTHSDWMMHGQVPWGVEGVRHMLDACRDSGWTRVYWRLFDGGKSFHSSRLFDTAEDFETDNIITPALPDEEELAARLFAGSSLATRAAREAWMARCQRCDYEEFDVVNEAVRYGHEIGLEVHGWVSINEDDHGWGLTSRFTKSHPECRWVKRDGQRYRSQLSFAFPEVRAYKLAALREILERFALDGLFLDWIRTGDIRDNPQNDPEGVADRGYEAPALEGFQREFGIDPRTLANADDRWVRYRAEPHTLFMREARAVMRALAPGKPLAVMVHHPWSYRGNQDWIDGNLRGMLLDVSAWAREGLIDEAVAAGYYMKGGTPEKAYRALAEELDGRARQWLYAWVPQTAEDLARDHALAHAVAAPQILFWEADYIDLRPDREALQRVMRQAAPR